MSPDVFTLFYSLGRVTCPEPVPHLSSEEQQNLQEDGCGICSEISWALGPLLATAGWEP